MKTTKKLAIIISYIVVIFVLTGCLNIETVSEHNEKVSKEASDIIIQTTTASSEATSSTTVTETTTAEDTATITFLIKCDVLLSEENVADNTGENGILFSSALSVKKDSTVFDVLKSVCSMAKLSLSYSGDAGTAYITAIGGIEEKEYSKYSGWKYDVNGETLSSGCGSYTINDGDVIEFYYVTTY